MTKLKLNTESKAWIAYDAGNSAFATTIVAAFFPIFYTEFWSSGVDSLVATSYYTWTLTISNLVQLLLLVLLQTYLEQLRNYLPYLL